MDPKAPKAGVPPSSSWPETTALVGNLFDMPTKNFATALRELNRTYGDIVYLNVFGQSTVIIGSYDTAVTLLKTRSANTSDRPRLMMGELTGFLFQFALMGYSERWRQCRRTFHDFFQQGVVPQYRPIQLREARRLLKGLLDTPEDFLAHARRAVGATVMDVIYGFEGLEKDNKYGAIAERATNVFSAVVVPGRFLVELFPALAYVPKWLPGAKFKRDAGIWKEDVLALWNVPFDAAVQAMTEGHARPSMISTLVTDSLQDDGTVPIEDEAHFKDVAGVTCATGTDTTDTSLTIFFLSMVMHPDIQRKAQAELDAVIGPDRLPTFSDCDSLPYVHAVVKECLRWHSVLPLAIPHKSIKDDEYNGYLIPAGSVLVPNVWAMSKDPVAYPDPEKFMPERFLKDGEINVNVRDTFRFQSGFGRRWRHFAFDTMFIIIASVLHTFDIRPPPGPDGSTLHIDARISLDECISHADPFPCVITPRSAKADALVRQPDEYGEL